MAEEEEEAALGAAAEEREEALPTAEERWLSYSSGAEVLAFFRSNDHPQGCRYVRVQYRSDSFPLLGLSAGWLRGRVSEDFLPDNFAEGARHTYVHVQFQGLFQDPRHGHSDGLTLCVHPRYVRCPSLEVLPAPLLSVFCVRWWDYWTSTRAKGRPSDWDATDDGMVVELFEGRGGLQELLPGEYEVRTAWIRSSADLAAISGEEVRGILQGLHTTAWYLLRPVKRSDADTRSGEVCESQLFNLCHRVERQGIVSGWPHVAHVWQLLAGRLWAPQMCLHPDFSVPPTTRAHYAEFMEDTEGVAQRVLSTLVELRQRSCFSATAAELYGVVKLGLPSASEGFLTFRGSAGLVAALHKSFGPEQSSQIVCLVQALPPHLVCERRVVCFNDMARGEDEFVRVPLWAPLRGVEEPWSDNSVAAVLETEAPSRFFRGSQAAADAAARQADALVEQWLLWFCAESPEAPQTVRFDFLVSLPPDSQEVSVWSWEIVPCGGPLCGLSSAPRSTAAVNSALRNADAGGRVPMALPPVEWEDGESP